MTLLQIQYAIACAQTGSFTRAAASMFTTVSNLSKMIKSLEQELGYTLFERSNTGIVTTSSGAHFLEHAHRIMREIMIINRLDEKRRSSLTITFMYTNHILPVVESLLRDADPAREMTYNVISCSHMECINRLTDGQSDLSITSIPSTFRRRYIDTLKARGVMYDELSQMDLAILVRKGHPLLRESESGAAIDMPRLGEYPYIYIDKASNENFVLDIPPFHLDAVMKKTTVLKTNLGVWCDDIIAATDGYGMRHCTEREQRDAPDLVYIPVKKGEIVLYALYPADGPSAEALDFVRRLRKCL